MDAKGATETYEELAKEVLASPANPTAFRHNIRVRHGIVSQASITEALIWAQLSHALIAAVV